MRLEVRVIQVRGTRERHDGRRSIAIHFEAFAARDVCIELSYVDVDTSLEIQSVDATGVDDWGQAAEVGAEHAPNVVNDGVQRLARQVRVSVWPQHVDQALARYASSATQCQVRQQALDFPAVAQVDVLAATQQP